MRHPRVLLPVVAALGATALALAVPATADPGVTGAPEPDPGRDRGYVIDGRDVFPEGIAADRRFVYVTSKADGTVYRGAVDGTRLQPFLRGGDDGRTTATGIASAGGRLLVAGAETGRLFVHDARTGDLVVAYTVPDPERASFVNDVVVAPDGDAYVTDSQRPVVYRIPAEEWAGQPTADARTLEPAIQLPPETYGEGFNANGITATRDGRALIVVYSNSGALYRVDLGSGAVTEVALDRPLVNGDGLVLRGRTLYAARNFDNLVVRLWLSSDGTRATTVAERTYPGADVPTTLAVSRGRLLAVNSQFDTFFSGAPLTSETFTVSSLPLR